jgi:hypothetical protein
LIERSDESLACAADYARLPRFDRIVGIVVLAESSDACIAVTAAGVFKRKIYAPDEFKSCLCRDCFATCFDGIAFLLGVRRLRW